MYVCIYIYIYIYIYNMRPQPMTAREAAPAEHVDAVGLEL